MRSTLSGEDWAGWVRYYNAEPFGFSREESRHAAIAVSMWALHGGKDAPAHYRNANHWKHGLVAEIDEEDTEAVMQKLGG